MAHARRTQKGVTSPPQWDGFLYVLSTLDLKSLSLDDVQNLDKMLEPKGSSKEKW